MSKKARKKQKHIPQRTCVGCRDVQPKRSMTRIVRTSEGIQIDLTGKVAGRGAYLHNLKSCWGAGLKGSLSRALKADISGDDRECLIAFMESLPDESVKFQKE